MARRTRPVMAKHGGGRPGRCRCPARQPTEPAARLAKGGKLRHRRAAMGALANLTFPVLRLLDPERAHGLALLALRSGLVGPGERTRSDPRLRLTWLGHSVASPIGLAAGFDKNATCVAALARLGFGALEVGTVTPLPQPGNPRPRMFRLPESAAVINRMGFNSDGLERVARRLGRAERPVPLGVNIGPNKASADPPQELARMVGALAGHVDWVDDQRLLPEHPGLAYVGRPRSAWRACCAGFAIRPRNVRRCSSSSPRTWRTSRWPKSSEGVRGGRRRRSDRGQYHRRTAARSTRPPRGGDRGPVGPAAHGSIHGHAEALRQGSRPAGWCWWGRVG